MREKKKIKEGGGDRDRTLDTYGGEKQEEKKRKIEMKRMDENEMKERKNNIKNKIF